MSKIMVLKTQTQINVLHDAFTHYLTYADNYQKINGHYPFNGYSIEDAMATYFGLPKWETLEAPKVEKKKWKWIWKKFLN